jgi:hypothetical protein
MGRRWDRGLVSVTLKGAYQRPSFPVSLIGAWGTTDVHISSFIKTARRLPLSSSASECAEFIQQDPDENNLPTPERISAVPEPMAMSTTPCSTPPRLHAQDVSAGF